MATLPTYGQSQEIQGILSGSNLNRQSNGSTTSKRGRKAKGNKTMTPQTNEAIETEVNDVEQNSAPTQGDVKRIQKTVFDLNKFSRVTLYKDVTLPKKPETIQEAMSIFENDTKVLLEVIYNGLISRTLAQASAPVDGKLQDFHLPGDTDYPLDMKNPLGPVYEGSYADEDKQALINSAVLSMAKMLGYSQDNTKEKNDELKAQAMKVIRDNPVMMKSLQG